MSTQATDFVDKDFSERVLGEKEDPTLLQEVAGSLQPVVQVVREVIYDPPAKWFISGTIFGALLVELTSLIARFH